MERPSKLGDKQYFISARNPIVIDLLDDTPRPAVKSSRVKPKARESGENVLDDSDDLPEIETQGAKNTTKNESGNLLDENTRPWSTRERDISGAETVQRLSRNGSKPIYNGITEDTGKRKKTDDSDPIVFTSPTVQSSIAPSRHGRMRKALSPLSDEFEDIDDLLGLRAKTNSTQSGDKTDCLLSDRTAKLLNSLKRLSPDGRKDDPRKRTGDMAMGLPPAPDEDLGHTTSHNKHAAAPTKRKAEYHGGHDNIAEDPSIPRKRPVRAKLTLEEKEERAREKERERERKRIEKEADKIIEKENREKLKARKAQEKELASQLASANRLKLDKKVSSLEMIVDLSSSLQGTYLGKQVESLLSNIQVEPVYTSDCPIPNIVRWRRKITAKFNDELGHWEPIPTEIKPEKHVMCILSAKEFVDMTQVDVNEIAGKDIDSHVLRIKSRLESCRLIYLIEGLNIWMRKNKNVRNRKFQDAVLNQGRVDNGIEQSASRVGARKTTQEYIDEDLIGDALLRLQVVHHCLIHHTTAFVETAEWVANFTQHISTIPYRSQRMDLEASFCMESGQVKTGEDKKDTYIKMLQEIVRVTAPVAYGIAAEYPDLSSLMEALRQSGPTVLQDLKVSKAVNMLPLTQYVRWEKTANKNGAFTNNNIGPAISKRVHKIFMGTDPTSTEV